MSVGQILLIEDEATSREILELILSGAGYTVDVAATAAVAHKQLRGRTAIMTAIGSVRARPIPWPLEQ